MRMNNHVKSRTFERVKDYWQRGVGAGIISKIPVRNREYFCEFLLSIEAN